MVPRFVFNYTIFINWVQAKHFFITTNRKVVCHIFSQNPKQQQKKLTLSRTSSSAPDLQEIQSIEAFVLLIKL